ncbi:MAG: hypothetical protein ACI9KM_003003 [Rubritalea sp.]|jgi:hypothetical protein
MDYIRMFMGYADNINAVRVNQIEHHMLTLWETIIVIANFRPVLPELWLLC